VIAARRQDQQLLDLGGRSRRAAAARLTATPDRPEIHGTGSGDGGIIDIEP
jgi:hypothetical protein